MPTKAMKQLLVDVAATIAVALPAVIFLWTGRILLASRLSTGTAGTALTLDDLVGMCASACGLLLTAWWLMAMLAAFVGELVSARGSNKISAATSRFSPLFMRRLAATILGLNLLAAPSAFADGGQTPIDPLWHPSVTSTSQISPTSEAVSPTLSASPTLAVPSESAVSSPTPSSSKPIDPAWIPHATAPDAGNLAPQIRREAPAHDDHPSSTLNHRPNATHRGTEPQNQNRSVVVLRGDSLWSIAAAALGPHANDQEIARAWPLWYQANQTVIGADPSIILPGQVLMAPAPSN